MCTCMRVCAVLCMWYVGGELLCVGVSMCMHVDIGVPTRYFMCADVCYV